jgi:hypothetical protein
MRMQWCWRCKKEVPMLDDDEHARVWSAYQRSLQALDRAIDATVRIEDDTAVLPDPASIPTESIFASAEEEYEKVTGRRDVTTHAVQHHRISKYGPPCKVCGKPLRTAVARSCAACGAAASTG